VTMSKRILAFPQPLVAAAVKSHDGTFSARRGRIADRKTKPRRSGVLPVGASDSGDLGGSGAAADASSGALVVHRPGKVQRCPKAFQARRCVRPSPLEQISLGLNRRDSQRPANEGVSCP
jgi:hypothetical protein